MLFFTPHKRRSRLVGAFSLAVFVTFLWLLWSRSKAYALDDEYAPEMVENEGFKLTSNANTTKILLVAALFLLPKAKHSEEVYVDWWVPRLLENVTTDLYLFVPPNVPRMETMLKRRPKHLSFYLDTNFTTPFDTPPLKGLEAQYERNNDIDPEKGFHGPHLYAVWNSKPFFLNHATKVLAAQGKNYDYVFWNDAGSFREHSVYSKWPDPQRVEQVFEEAAKKTSQRKKDMIFFPMCDFPQPSGKTWTEAMGPYPSDAESFSEGECLVHLQKHMRVSILIDVSRCRLILRRISRGRRLVCRNILCIPQVLARHGPLYRQGSKQLQHTLSPFPT